MSGVSILNNEPLRIGGASDNVATGKGFCGTIQFLEIWSGYTVKDQSPGDYSAWRFANLGSVTLGPQLLDQPVLSETFSFDLSTEKDVVYRLESAIGIGDSPWDDSGARLVGDGQTMTFFDPAGLSARKIYRVGIE